MKFRIRYADRIVGLFVLLAAFALVAIVAMAGVSQRWFAKDYHFDAILDSAAGASPGTAIFMRGFQVGKILSVHLEGATQVRARFVIYDTYRYQVKEHSLLEIVTSPIGLGTQILFHPGRGQSLLAEGEIIPEASSEEGRRLIEADLVEIPRKDDTITRLLASVNPLVDNMSKTVVSLNQTLGELNKALVGEGSTPVARIVGDASGAVAGVNRFVSSADKAVREISASANTLISRVDSLAANLATLSEGLSDPTGLVPKLLDPQGSIKTLLNDNNALYDGINNSVSELVKGVSSLSAAAASIDAEMPGLSATLSEARSTIKQASDVLEGLKNNPLLRGGIPKRVEPPAIYESLREGLF